MTKANLVDAVAEKTGMKKKDAENAVCAVFDAMKDALIAGEKVQVVGFGTFNVKERAEREGRNPYTGEAMKIAASKHVSFTIGKTLKDQL